MKTARSWRKAVWTAGFIAVLFGLGALIYRKDQDVTKHFRLIKENHGIREYRFLPNGLRLLLCEDHSAPVASVMIAYQVGSGDEPEGRTGISHMLEHMMFKGTRKYRRDSGNSLPMMLGQAGGVINATTGMDATHFFAVIPSGRISLALELEADRMRGALLEGPDFKTEKDVVMNEFEMLENSPVMALEKKVWETAYEKHPYRHHTIGLRADLAALTAGALKDYYLRYYRPDNAWLIVTGDFRTDALLREIDRIFSKIPKCPEVNPRVAGKEPAQTAKRHVKVVRPDQGEAVLVAAKSPEGLNPDIYALEVLSQILTGGKTSRLYRELVDRQLAAEVSSSVSAYRDPGLFGTWAFLLPGVRHEEIEKKIFETYRDIRERGVSQQELASAKRRLSVRSLYAWDGVQSITDGLGEAVSLGDWNAFPDDRKNIERVGAEDVRRVAGKYLVPDLTTVGYLFSKPAAESKPSAKQEEGNPAPRPREEGQSSVKPVLLDRLPDSAKGARISDQVRVRDFEGMRLMTLQRGIPGAVILSGSIKGAGSSYHENAAVADMTAAMLELGTRHRDKFEIAKVLEEKGAEISFDAGPTRLIFYARFLKEDLAEVVGLMAELLRFPAFNEDELGKLKDQAVVSLEHRKTDTESVASQAISQLIYESTHPNYQLSFDDQIECVRSLTAEELRKFHREHYGKNDLIVVAVGDVDEGAVADVFAKALEGWKTLEVNADFQRNVTVREPRRKIIEIRDKRNLDLFFGHGMPLTRKSPEYPAAALASFALGGDFSSRLTSDVRDRHGLTYAVHSSLGGITGDIEGDWSIHMITTPPLLGEATARVREVTRRFVEEGLTPEELLRNQNTVTGQLKVNLATSGALAEQIRRTEEMGMGLRYLDEFPEKIRGLGLEDVNRTLRRFFHPEKLNEAVAGDAAAVEPTGT
jgi:zinc protease